MKKLLIASLILNFLLILSAGIIIISRGGVSYIKALIGISEPKPFVELASMGSYWKDRVSLFEVIEEDTGKIVFIGDSFTDGCEWSELFKNPNILNRGIRGEKSTGILLRINEVCANSPSKIFLATGFNDMASGIPTSSIIKNYESITDSIRLTSPKTEIFWQEMLPDLNIPNVSNDTIRVINQLLAEFCQESNCSLIKLHDLYVDDSGALDPKLTNDGIHLNGAGYLIWKAALENYVNN